MDEKNTSILPLFKEIIFVDKVVKDLPTPQMGNYNKSILVLYGPADDNEASKQLLTKVLQACAINIEDIYAFCISNPYQANELINTHAPLTIINFKQEIKTEELQLLQELYKPAKFKNSILLFCHSLSEIATNQDAKAALWNSLKKIFKIA